MMAEWPQLCNKRLTEKFDSIHVTEIDESLIRNVHGFISFIGPIKRMRNMSCAVHLFGRIS